jgi:acetylornithine deacetylase/succinyl-diaminopimelate desuccinylase-like protein
MMIASNVPRSCNDAEDSPFNGNRMTRVTHSRRSTALAAFAVVILFTSIAAQVSAQGLTPVQQQVREYRSAHERAILRNFVDFLALPNVASDTAGIFANSTFLSGMMSARGLEPRYLTAAGEHDIVEGYRAGASLVYGEWIVPGATRTIVMYAHYDGQPTDPAKWTESKPWNPVFRSAALEKGGRIIPFPSDGSINPEYRIYARSASDDKAGVMAFLTAIDALKASGRFPSVNLKFVFDGEEEAGSPHLDAIIRKNAELLKADAWIICDGPVHQSGRKEVVFGVRGDANVDMTVYGANRPLHSGHYGNWAPNPAMSLVHLLASMKDESGRVLIKGWYDDVSPLGSLERRVIRESPPFDDTLRTALGFKTPDGNGKSLAELINLPSLNINGIVSAEAGPGARNIIPTTASTTLDLRLVKGNDYKRQIDKLIAHVRAQGFHVIDHPPTEAERLQYSRLAMVTQRGGGYNAQRTPMDLPVSKAVLSAISGVFPGRTLAVPTLGGSLPLSVIADALNVPTITVPIANYDNNQHAEDESIRIQNLWDGIDMMAALMTMKFDLRPVPLVQHAGS